MQDNAPCGSGSVLPVFAIEYLESSWLNAASMIPARIQGPLLIGRSPWRMTSAENAHLSKLPLALHSLNQQPKKKRAPFVFCSVWSTRKRKPLFLSPYVSTRGWHTKETQVLGLISPLAAIKTNPETGTKTNFSGGVLPLLAIVYHGGIIPHS